MTRVVIRKLHVLKTVHQTHGDNFVNS